jgi:protocatechuate 3,4-dioxygenase, alpha subunit
MSPLPATPSQTVGPFFHDCLLRVDRCEATAGDGGDVQIHVEGRVIDGDGAGVPDAVIEVWQSAGFARIGTDAEGGFSFSTRRPKRVELDRGRIQAPHLSLAVFARGLMNHLLTRIYFDDEPSTESDPILRLVPEARRTTLIARRASDENLTPTYRFDIVLQGAGETAFFDFRSPAR